MHVALDFRKLARPPGDFQVIEVLQIEPELRVGVEEPRQAQSGLGGYPAALMHNFADAGRRNVQFKREPVGRQVQRLHEIFVENLSGMDWRH